ncbi:hypothetical protein MBLNU457_6585t3 [Dothideomycetes sp. NU457]
MERKALLPLIVFDVIVNVYLTALFLLPLRSLYSFKKREGGSNTLRRMAFRTFIGACATLISSIVNLTVLTALHGEPGWICLMLCNADILFSVLVLHWVTTFDQKNQNSESARTRPIGGTGTFNEGTRRGPTRRNSVDDIRFVEETSKLGVVESNVEGNVGGEFSKEGTIVKAVMVTQESSPREG